MTCGRETFFLADSHLRGPADENQPVMIRFLEEHASSTSTLVVVGDMFDFMAGYNRAVIEAYRPVLDALSLWPDIHFFEGNHDFDLSPRMPGLRGARLWTRPSTIRVSGRDVRVLHGDRASPSDIGTRLLRMALQSTSMRFIRDHILPDGLVFRFALAFATMSRRNTWPGRGNEEHHARLRAISEAVGAGTDMVVFAHTHKSILMRLDDITVANPGAAVDGGSFLFLKDNIMRLRRFPDGETLDPGPLEIN